MLEHPSEALNAVFYDKATLPADEKNNQQETEKQIYTQLGEKADSSESVKHSVGINSACNQQNNDSLNY